MNASTLVVLVLVGIVALMFYSLHANKKEIRNLKDYSNNDPSAEEQQAEEMDGVMDNTTVQNNMVRKSQTQRLREKASQVESFQWVLDILFVLDAVCGIWLVSDIMPDDSSTIFTITIIVGTIIAIYAVNIWSTTKQELCKGQAEILEKLEKME